MNLPIELFEKIFNFIDLKTKLKCRLLSKEICYLIDNKFKIDQLFFLKESDLRDQFDLVNCPNLILDTKINLKFVKLTQKLTLFETVKELIIYDFIVSDVLKIINLFDNIEKLNIDKMDENLDAIDMHHELFVEQNVFKLMNLKIFELNYENKCPFIFNCPKLTKIKFNLKYQIDLIFKYENTIEYAEFNEYNNCIENLINLKVLYCDNFTNFNVPNDLLIKLKQLEELYTIQEDDYKEFNRQKIQYNNNNLKLFYLGMLDFDLNKNQELSKTELNEDNLNIYFEKYKQSKLASKLPFLNIIYYDELNSIYTQLQDEFLRLFCGLESVVISGKIENERQFIKFINNCGQFIALQFRVDSFKPSTLELLSKNFQSTIKCLIIYSKQIDDNDNQLTEDLNKFIFKFNKITDLHIYTKFSFSLIKKFYTELKYSKRLIFIHNSSKYEICYFNCIEDPQDDSYDFYLYDDNDEIEKILDPNQLDDIINYLKKNKKIRLN